MRKSVKIIVFLRATLVTVLIVVSCVFRESWHYIYVTVEPLERGTTIAKHRHRGWDTVIPLSGELDWRVRETR